MTERAIRRASREIASDTAGTGDVMLDADARRALWTRLTTLVERYVEDVERGPVAPAVNLEALRERLAAITFDEPLAPADALSLAAAELARGQVHVAHPRYFGLFNPAPTTMGIAADALVAAYNPQLAAWSHNPFASEVERHLVRAFAARFGLDARVAEGTFTSGGMEANHTALLLALTARCPAFVDGGLRALAGQPVLYVSSESHHSVAKAARLVGLGAAAVRHVPTDAAWRMDAAALDAMIASDRRAGHLPFLVVATAGTTSAGVIDPLPAIADVAGRTGTWLHVDAAWGGTAVLDPELRRLLAGIERADSITMDCHKWMGVPMGAGLVITRHAGVLERAFRIETGYMPVATSTDVADPFAHSMQWSRRFIGLKVFLSLVVAGWEGYAAAIRHQRAMGERLARGLAAGGWELVNDPALLVYCFVDGSRPDGRSGAYLDGIARHVVASGEAWISTARLGARDGSSDVPVLRACITNMRTGANDIDTLLATLDRARAAARAGAPV